jgi:hypothetical protein
MYRPRLWTDDSEQAQAANRQSASLAGVAVTLALLTVGLFLVDRLRTNVAIEDCLLAGRRNCDALVVRPASWDWLTHWLTHWLPHWLPHWLH